MPFDPMPYETLTKFEIAERQLFRAIDLYMAGDLVCSITLAGAAEEILGKLVSETGNPHALDTVVVDLCSLFESVFKEPANPKSFVHIRTAARNSLKHIGTGEPVELDFEQEAVNILDRAVENYQRLQPGRQPKFREFQNERVKRCRKLTKSDA